MSKSILIVDDNTDSRCILAKLLGKSGYIVETAVSLDDGIVALGLKTYDILICDLNLGNNTNCYQLRPLHKGVAIVVSGACLDSDKDNTKAAGFDTHIGKPIDLKLLEGLLVKLVKP